MHKTSHKINTYPSSIMNLPTHFSLNNHVKGITYNTSYNFNYGKELTFLAYNNNLGSTHIL